MASSGITGNNGTRKPQVACAGGITTQRAIIGELCDYFVRQERKEIEIISPYSASLIEAFPVVLGNGKAGPVCHFGTSNPMEGYKKGLEEKFGSSVLPAFLIKDKTVFLEVKIDGKPDLKEEQKVEFDKVIKKGYKIFIIVPKISVKPRKIEVERFEGFELEKGGRKKKIEFKELKKLVR
jgi:hypothetical protein